MVDDDLVAAIGAQGGLDGLRDSLAGLDVADDGSIFGIVAGIREEWSVGGSGELQISGAQRGQCGRTKPLTSGIRP